MTSDSHGAAGVEDVMNADGSIWPDRATFRSLAATHRVIPVVRTLLADSHTALSAYEVLAAHRPGSFLFESAEHASSWSRWSFIGVRSQALLTSRGDQAQWLGRVPEGLRAAGSNPLEELRASMLALHSPHLAGLPPLTGGLVGFMAYDAVRFLEKIGDSCVDELGIPSIGFLLATDIAALDHHRGTITLIANAINFDNSEHGVDEAWDSAVARLEAMSDDLARPSPRGPVRVPNVIVEAPAENESFLQSVDIAKEHIRAGDAFQIVLSQRFRTATHASAFDIYRALRMSNPSPYMFLMRIPAPPAGEDDIAHGCEVAFDIIGSSPEALVRVIDGEAMLHPIAGTRPRGSTPEEDAELASGLLDDQKERAEHLMLVDLGRNDLGRVCTAGSVQVVDFMSVERYSHVMHLVSTVTGTVRPELTGCDVLYATFPAGTLSGAPKPRAMQIIEDLESSRRGVYGGAVGYLDFAGNVDMAIAIRTALLKDGIAYVQAGAGIVADSDPASESAECRHKAAAVLRAVEVAGRMRL